MDIEKVFLDKYLSSISKDTFAVEYWDNDRKIYGEKDSEVGQIYQCTWKL